MSRLKKAFDKLFTFIPGYVFGILAFLFGFFGNIISLILTPEYEMWQLSISMLTLAPTGIFLRIGLIISNICAVLFIIYLGRSLLKENINENIRKVAIGTGILSSISALLTGAITGINPIISNLHGLFALFSWIGGGTTCLLFGILMLKSTNFSKAITFSGFIVAGIFIAYLVPFFICNFCSYFPEICYSFGQKIYIVVPSWEWAVIFSILYWYLSNSIYILYKKFNKSNNLMY
ncbi:MAG: hypothetical protein ACFFG0_45735 [Candidatus Thorarchaeota archaeon]